LRELFDMAEAKRRDAWLHTSNLLAMLANCHRDPKKSSAAKPKDFNPYTQRTRPVKRASVDVLKVFINKRCRDVFAEML